MEKELEPVIVIGNFDSLVKARKVREVIAGLLKARYYPDRDYYSFNDNGKERKLEINNNKAYAKPTYNLIVTSWEKIEVVLE